MGLAKYNVEQQKKMLQDKIKQVEDKDVKGWIARMAKHYELKKLKQQLKDISNE